MKHRRIKTLLLKSLVFLITCVASVWLFQAKTQDVAPMQVVTISETESQELLYPELDDTNWFNLLGDKSHQQLIVSLTAPRSGRHWVVSFHPKFNVLFDSSDFDVGREEFGVVDLDKDGVYEISLPIVSYYGMDGLRSVSETPLPEIVFKYDSKQNKYLPANHLFVDYVLRDVKRKSESETYKHRRFDILLNYVYAGKEKEGWASFDAHYPSEDKELMRWRIKTILKDDPVYKFIYQQQK